MTHELRLADIGEGLEEAEILEWKVAVGDTVRRDQPIVEIMTDKSNAELPAPVDGVVVELGGAIGDIIEVGHLVAVIAANGGASGAPSAPAIEIPVDDSEPTATTFRSATASSAPNAPAPSPADAREAEQHTPLQPAQAAAKHQAPPQGARPKASPSTRADAARRGIDLHTVTGSGPGGRILASDLDQHQQSAATFATATAPPPAPPAREAALPEPELPTAPAPEAATPDPEPPAPPAPAPATSEPEPTTPDAPVTPKPASPVAEVGAPTGPDDAPGHDSSERPSNVEPLRGIRRVIATNMAQSWSTIPHIHVSELIDAEPMLAFRTQLRTSGREAFATLTPVSFFIAAVAAALDEHRVAAARLDLDEGTITHADTVDVGIAVASPTGLVVPVLRDAASRSLTEIAAETHRLVQGARDSNLSPDDFRGGTTTITNFGSLGGELAQPLIRPGESTIFGFGSIAARPFVVDDAVVARSTMHVVVGADHRLLDGDVATALLRRVADLLTTPINLVLG